MKRNFVDFVADLGRTLNFTKSNFYDINGLFVEKLPNQRYHLHLYSRDLKFSDKLKRVAMDSSDNLFKTIRVNNNNVLVALLPKNNSIYKIKPMEENNRYKERIIQFTTGLNRTILDVLLMTKIKKYPIEYIVCNRQDTFIAFERGTDAVLAMGELKDQQIEAFFTNNVAYVEYVDNTANDLQQGDANLQITANNNSRVVYDTNANQRTRRYRQRTQYANNNRSDNRNHRASGARQRNEINNNPYQRNRQARFIENVQQSTRRREFRSQGRVINNCRRNNNNQSFNPNNYKVVLVPKRRR
jgi:hypothetical protein